MLGKTTVEDLRLADVDLEPCLVLDFDINGWVRESSKDNKT
jgi:hypothetical protein